MFRFVLIVTCFIVFSCNSTKVKAQDNSKKSTKNTTLKPKILPKDLVSAPSTILIKAQLLELIPKGTICGAELDGLVKIKIHEILNIGAGITNMPSLEQEILMMLPIKKSPDSLKVGDLLKLHAVEKRCFNAADSKYMILDYSKEE